jgi:hypothetical protein
VAVTFRHWLRLGWQVHERFRLQLLQQAGLGWREASGHVRLFRSVEVGLLGNVVTLEDPHRRGLEGGGLLGGLGLFADIPLGAFQLDVRAGWTPDLGSDQAGWNVLIALAWNWASA